MGWWGIWPCPNQKGAGGSTSNAFTAKKTSTWGTLRLPKMTPIPVIAVWPLNAPTATLTTYIQVLRCGADWMTDRAQGVTLATSPSLHGKAPGHAITHDRSLGSGGLPIPRLSYAKGALLQRSPRESACGIDQSVEECLHRGVGFALWSRRTISSSVSYRFEHGLKRRRPPSRG